MKALIDVAEYYLQLENFLTLISRYLRTTYCSKNSLCFARRLSILGVKF